MNKQTVLRRLESLDGSSGSVVTAASWCVLHASQAPLIITCLCERLVSESTTDSTRCALLYVIHEMLISCVMNGVTDNGKRTILHTVSNMLPAALKAVFQSTGTAKTEFSVALKKVTSWWTVLNILPPAWVASLPQPRSSQAEAVSRSEAMAVSNAPAEVQNVVQRLKSFNEAKETLKKVQESGSQEDIADARHEALRRLVLARKAVEGNKSSVRGGQQGQSGNGSGKNEEDGEDGNGEDTTVSLLGLLDSERAALGRDDDDANGLEGDGGLDVADADVLGSFFS